MSGAARGQMSEKFRELILYICDRSRGDHAFGALKLNKLLFYADLNAYQLLGRTITDQPYQKLEMGPAPRYLVSVRDQMIQDGDLIEDSLKSGGRIHRRPIAKREADLDIFSASEIDIVNRLLEGFQNTSGTDLSELSHEFIGWSVAEIGENINFNTALISARPLTTKERVEAGRYREVAEKCIKGDFLSDVTTKS